MGDVRLDRPLADDELGRNLRVRQSSGKELEHLSFSWCEGLELRLKFEACWVPMELVEDGAGHLRSDERVSSSDHTNRLDDLLGRRLLQDESTRPRAERGHDQLVEPEGRQHHNARRDLGVSNPPRCLDAVEDRHSDVHEDDVRSERKGLLDCSLTILGLSDDEETVVDLEDSP